MPMTWALYKIERTDDPARPFRVNFMERRRFKVFNPTITNENTENNQSYIITPSTNRVRITFNTQIGSGAIENYTIDMHNIEASPNLFFGMDGRQYLGVFYRI